jgi:clan AA aspartic protease (TIGR02281 family)
LGGDLLRWVDDAGITHFARSLESVPQKYRDQVKPEKVRTENTPKAASEQRSSVNPRTPNAVAVGGEKPAPSVYEVPFEDYEGEAQRVIVSVTFNGSVTVPMLIDTGAPDVMISPKVAKRLGLFGNDEGMVVTAAGGIGGKVPAVRTFLDTVQVGGAKDTFIPATITESISESFEGLIGMVFMSKYSFKIDSAKKMVIFEEVQPDSRAPGGRNERWWRSQFKELRALHDAWEEYSSRKDLDDQDRAFARSQVNEAEKLLSKLDRHASLYSVPHPWR